MKYNFIQIYFFFLFFPNLKFILGIFFPPPPTKFILRDSIPFRTFFNQFILLQSKVFLDSLFGFVPSLIVVGALKIFLQSLCRRWGRPSLPGPWGSRRGSCTPPPPHQHQGYPSYQAYKVEVAFFIAEN